MKVSTRPANSFTILAMKRIATLKDTEGSFIMGQGKYKEVIPMSASFILSLQVENKYFYIQLEDKVYQNLSPLLETEMMVQFIGQWKKEQDVIVPLDLILVTEEEELVFQVK